uniref:Uncharacterized protein n=1 Tax=Physcomitrium patens TaxID=3218 RepID=A0A2K1J9S6_PHYPA|nr:hypothetical protein PHYPA_021393 [Physcomitrium patens]
MFSKDLALNTGYCSCWLPTIACHFVLSCDLIPSSELKVNSRVVPYEAHSWVECWHG